VNTSFRISLPAPAAHREDDDARRAQVRSWLGAAIAGAGFALAFSTLVSVLPASAQEANRIWAGCTLGDLAADLEEQIQNQSGSGPRNIADAEVAFVVVYSLNNGNDGQPVGTSGFTGPVICTAPGFSIATTSQTATINNANILDAEDAFFLRYQVGSSVRKRVCHTVGSSTDCFTVQ